MRVSLLQFAPTRDLAGNLETIRGLVGLAAVDGPEWQQHLMLLPEAAMHEIGPPDLALGAIAEPLDGPFVGALAELARHAGVTLGAGVYETSDDPDRPFHTYVLVDAGGDLIASYRKAHLFDAFGFRESDRLMAGDGTPVLLKLGDLLLGLMTCYDLRFPEQALGLVQGGADVLAVPAAWVAGPHKEDHWRTLLRARAIESTAYVVAPAQCGRGFVGASMVVDPIGVVVAEAVDGPGVVTAPLDREVLDRVRELIPTRANRGESTGVTPRSIIG